MSDRPEDRAKAVAALAKAALMAVAYGGDITEMKTTVAVTSKAATKAMRAAKKIKESFRSAGQTV